MKSKLAGVFLFIAGAAVGSAVTWKFVKTKYERIAQEEIDSVKEVFAKNHSIDIQDFEEETEVADNDGSEADHVDPQDEMMERYDYEAALRRLKYISTEAVGEGGGEPVILAPYVISPDEYGEDGYETTMLSYYADGVLEDDYWNIIDNVEDVIGTDFINHFGDYEEDTVFIRNEEHRTDYEVTRDKRTYAESQQYSSRGLTGDA